MNALDNLATAEIEALLAKRKKQEKEKREREKIFFEREKNELIENLFIEAEHLALAAGRFKNKCHQAMETQKQKLDQYGGIRSNSKGGFSIFHTDGTKRITRRRDTDPVWDERGQKAVSLIKDFLGDTVKKRDAKLHDILLGFLERNHNGDLEYSKVMELLKHEDKFNDSRWKEGLQLIKESYSLGFKSFTYEFKQKDKEGKWKAINLNFSSL